MRRGDASESLLRKEETGASTMSDMPTKSEALYDVRQDQFPTVIREMIRHENDVTNHRIMWLLVGEGFIANAYVMVKNEGNYTLSLLIVVGILIALSAFVMLYQSYQARGYLLFLGLQAKDGTLQEKHLPLMGWPRNRIKGWWRSVWLCPWIRRIGDLLEPWLLLPYLFITLWMSSLLRTQTRQNLAFVLVQGAILSAVILSISCIALVWSQSQDDESVGA